MAKELTHREVVSRGGKACRAHLSAERLSEIGRMGGLVGGKARAKKLTAKRRSEIARMGGKARAKQRAAK